MAAPSRLPLLFSRSLPPLTGCRHAHAEAPLREPAYPPVVASLTAKSKAARRRQAEEQVRRIRSSPAEEKLSLLTRQQRLKFVVYPQTFARDADRWYQHFTKTAYVPGLPGAFTRDPGRRVGAEAPAGAGAGAEAPAGPGAPAGAGADAGDLAELRSLVSDAILQERWSKGSRRPFLYRRQEHTFAPLLRNLVAGLTHALARHNPQLVLCSLDFNPQVHFYWRRGERTIPKGHRKGHLEPTRFQIDDCPHSQIRITQQLKQFTPMEDSYAAEVPEVPYAPNVMPLFRRQYDNNIFTGSKLPDPACYGHTQFHLVPDRYHRDRMARLQQSDQVEVFLRANGIASLFAWTGAQAMYQGFWDREDVTRPFVSQAVITDGKYFSFFCYQLNTVALSVQSDSDNPRKNLMWGTESLKLYDGVEDGNVVGLNDDVIKLLVQFLMNQP